MLSKHNRDILSFEPLAVRPGGRLLGRGFSKFSSKLISVGIKEVACDSLLSINTQFHLKNSQILALANVPGK
ncbi:hypothetical protein TNCV_3564881 [Trichonephila clavipes]|nr:hypothetical protein TNCV_3564881 [Trichonephila clavipes]